MGHEGKPSSQPRGKVIALITAATGFIYLVLQLIGAQYGWSYRVLGFFDLAALAIFGWALVSAFFIWRARQDD